MHAYEWSFVCNAFQLKHYKNPTEHLYRWGEGGGICPPRNLSRWPKKHISQFIFLLCWSDNLKSLVLQPLTWRCFPSRTAHSCWWRSERWDPRLRRDPRTRACWSGSASSWRTSSPSRREFSKTWRGGRRSVLCFHHAVAIISLHKFTRCVCDTESFLWVCSLISVKNLVLHTDGWWCWIHNWCQAVYLKWLCGFTDHMCCRKQVQFSAHCLFHALFHACIKNYIFVPIMSQWSKTQYTRRVSFSVFSLKWPVDARRVYNVKHSKVPWIEAQTRSYAIKPVQPQIILASRCALVALVTIVSLLTAQLQQ